MNNTSIMHIDFWHLIIKILYISNHLKPKNFQNCKLGHSWINESKSLICSTVVGRFGRSKMSKMSKKSQTSFMDVMDVPQSNLQGSSSMTNILVQGYCPRTHSSFSLDVHKNKQIELLKLMSLSGYYTPKFRTCASSH